MAQPSRTAEQRNRESRFCKDVLAIGVDGGCDRADSDGMGPQLGAVTFLVREYDEAVAFFTNQLRFELRQDQPLGGDKRWVLVAPRGGGTALLLARAVTAEQAAAVGRQGGGRVFLFLETDDFGRDYAAMRAAGVGFDEEPRCEAYGTVAVFRDLYGNKWDLLQRAGG